jgi:inhibitor of KinA sporulation pathway (predicted exonuclease)
MKIGNRYYLVIDLEATCSRDATVPREEMEIIEIGAVMVSARTFEAESEFQTFVCPVRHRQLTPFCIELTGIQPAQVAAAPTFPEAIAKMKEWVDGFDDALFCSWGDYDRKQFLQDCQYHQVTYPFAAGHLNLKAEFANCLGRQKQMGIGQALKNLGLEFEGSPHPGLGRRAQYCPHRASRLHRRIAHFPPLLYDLSNLQ